MMNEYLILKIMKIVAQGCSAVEEVKQDQQDLEGEFAVDIELWFESYA